MNESVRECRGILKDVRGGFEWGGERWLRNVKLNLIK